MPGPARLNESPDDRQPAAVAERVLVVEDDPATRAGLTELVRTWGFVADSAEDGEDALRKVTEFRPAIVVTDLVMPRMDGHALLKALREHDPDITVVLLTAQGSVESAVEAIKAGAYDYLTKPVDTRRLRILLQKAVERHETLREVKSLRRQLRDHGAFGPMIGSSPSMRKVYRIVEQAAPTSAPVLISGESGTGKELVARAIHHAQPARGRAVRRASTARRIPETLLESELFGHEKGAFTGAAERRTGVLRAGRTAARCFSTRSARCRRPAGQAAARAAGAASSRGSAATRSIEGRRAARRGDQPRPRRGRSPTGSSARTCTTGSTCSRSRCRRCASARKTSRC